MPSSITTPQPPLIPIPPLTLIIRFTTSLPDLPLSIASPRTTTPQTLHTLIRPNLPPALSACPLRLIHAGALLPPNTAIQTSLRLSATGKSPASIYVHCSVSTDRQLSSAELEAEKRLAGAALRPASSSTSSTSQNNDHAGEEEEGEGERERDDHDDDDDDDPSITNTNNNNNTSHDAPHLNPEPQPQQPLGFDRLLTAGLLPSEISSLRSQFLAIQAHTHTPDTMPSAAQMRLLEERWLDSGPFSSSSPGGAGGDEEWDGDDDGMAGGGGSLEDMLWGNVMGFFWAVGAVVWLVREEGVWSKRRRVGVVTGLLVNIAFCVLRVGV